MKTIVMAALLMGCGGGTIEPFDGGDDSVVDSGVRDSAIADSGGSDGSPAMDSSMPDKLVGSGTANDPWRSNPPLANCQAYLAAYKDAKSGSYVIAPTSMPFIDTCDMTTNGGGWTLLITPYVKSLGVQQRQYLYVYNTRWYASPATMVVWDWNIGQEATGSYAYFNGSTMSSFACNGSPEKPMFGVGCSNGGGTTAKCLPIYSSTPTDGVCEVCQDIPGAFGGAVCQTGVTVFSRP